MNDELILVEPTMEYDRQIQAYRKEFLTFGGSMDIDFARSESYTFEMPYLVAGEHVLPESDVDKQADVADLGLTRCALRSPGRIRTHTP